MTEYEKKVLKNWEEIYKRGQLTFWVLLSLKHSSKYMSEIKLWLKKFTNDTIQAEDRSLYRTLQRFYDIELVEFEMKSSKKGPDQKVYSLTELGKSVLEQFIDRNIKIFFNDDIKFLLSKNND